MRPQQNRRMRGRGGNNPSGGNNNNNNNSGNSGNGGRKGPNPLTRSYESNGPDVKIRGSAQQIAEKYTTLARDAQTSGDRVMAENYLQHAEHYNRIIMTAQAQMPQQPVRDMRDEDGDDEDGDDGFNTQSSSNDQPQPQPQPTQQQQPQQQQRNHQPRDNGTGPQPVIEGVPAEVALNQQDLGEQPSSEAAAQPEPRKEPRPRGRRPKIEAVAEQPQPEAVAPPSALVSPAAIVEQVVAGSGDAPEAEDEPVRKPRRPRRPRLKAGEEAAADGDAQPDEPITEAAQ